MYGEGPFFGWSKCSLYHVRPVAHGDLCYSLFNGIYGWVEIRNTWRLVCVHTKQEAMDIKGRHVCGCSADGRRSLIR